MRVVALSRKNGSTKHDLHDRSPGSDVIGLRIRIGIPQRDFAVRAIRYLTSWIRRRPGHVATEPITGSANTNPPLGHGDRQFGEVGVGERSVSVAGKGRAHADAQHGCRSKKHGLHWFYSSRCSDARSVCLGPKLVPSHDLEAVVLGHTDAYECIVDDAADCLAVGRI
jgi:hypothetical protein